MTKVKAARQPVHKSKPKEYDIGGYKFKDDGDRKLSKNDTVKCPDGTEVLGRDFQEMAAKAGKKLKLGTTYADLKRNAAKFLPDAKQIGRLVQKAKPSESVVSRELNLNGVHVNAEYMLDITDTESRSELRSKGYSFFKGHDGSNVYLLAVSYRDLSRAVTDRYGDLEPRDLRQRILSIVNALSFHEKKGS